ncbi:hypothetical protein AKJ39_01360 [candidate division MSBL1 archaeon SCGC-AAA259J03]|uniref:Nucleotide modification associated domain-containing protein n=1 Tax=candidate division MSBL1 archaeon SCGC-AAA259J03 TaxID=1698269 RepID=A0A656YXG4_9EURY|nr:hypothetical protein AKJ39_01360 [candidate division MSBL1 archaeon SCGC-AAA259J03]
MPQKLHSSQPHYDPEFETYTYGDPGRPKRNQLSKLEGRDLLIFYSGLEPQDFSDRDRLYVIGYFTISNVYDFRDLTPPERKDVFEKLPNNAHSKIGELNQDLVIVKGDPEKSELFEKALLIGDGKNPESMVPDLEGITGYSGGIQRAVGHWIDEEHIPETKKQLCTVFG